jgi:DNA-binding response OmpR family regulator
MRRQILLVNPEPSFADALAPLLTSNGFEVTRAADFREAAGALRGHTFDALVTAHRLGAHNGLHLVLRARVERPAVLTVVTSTLPDPQLEAEASAFGTVCVVAPWEDTGRLLDVLREAAPHPA